MEGARIKDESPAKNTVEIKQSSIIYCYTRDATSPPRKYYSTFREVILSIGGKSERTTATEGQA